MLHNRNTYSVAMENHHQLIEEEEEEMDDKKRKKKKPGLRSPLQQLNRITSRRRTKITDKNCSIPSSSTSVSIDARKGCLNFLLSSSSCSSSSNSSRSTFQKKPISKPVNKPTTKSVPNSSRPRSNKCSADENALPRKSFSLSSKKNPSFPSQRLQSQRSKLSSDLRANMKNSASGSSGRYGASNRPELSKLSSDLRANLKNSAPGNSGRYGVSNQNELKHKHEESRGLVGDSISDLNSNVADNLFNIESSTPVNKLACGSSLNSAIVVDATVNKPVVGEDSNSGKTPPVEASVSPEIQCGGSSILLPNSTATPVCYGAGHLISGVTDKRKCRAKGILTVGGPADSFDCGKISFGEDDNSRSVDVAFTESRTSLVPLPAEASLKWLDDGVGKDSNVNSGSPFMASASIGVSTSPSYCRQLSSDLASDSGEKNGSCNWDAEASTGKTRIWLLSPRFSCKIDKWQTGGERSHVWLGDETPSSFDPLSGRNLIQTPTSDSSLDRSVGVSWISTDYCRANEDNPELGSMGEIFRRISVSPKSQTQMWDLSGLSSRFAGLTSSPCSIDHTQQRQKSGTHASWISDTTVGNLSLSEMRISWREGLVSRILDVDELDSCRCLSDGENYGDRSDELQHKSPKACGTEECDSLTKGNLRSPEFLEHEPQILRKEKEASSLIGTNICAESISTDGGGLVASEDSDWTLNYKNRLFEV